MSAPERFSGSFTQQEPIPEAGIAAALEVMRSGRLHRYNTAEGETGAAAALEAAYARWQGSRHCLACASGGYAMATALRALGVGPGDAVLTNGWTLAPVPGAIAAVGAIPALVEITPDLVLDLDHLKARLAERPAALLLSNMRGHLGDMEAIAEACDAAGVPLVEDCAHTMGAAWNGRRSGSFGAFGCFSTQTYKHMNSGEGGLLVSDDDALMARAVLLSGSYMMYARHDAAPDPETFEPLREAIPNVSGRMDNLRAAILLPQLAALDDNIERWNARHDRIASRLRALPGLRVPERPAAEFYVGSSLQFLLPGAGAERMATTVARAAALGVELKWFGALRPTGFTSAHRSWGYMPAQDVPRTDAILATLLDMRIPLTFSMEDCDRIADILGHVITIPQDRAA
jgi:dTDP-4-amino-4,6-dideoxygalactose transaminase